jgi:protein SCO1
MKTALVGNAVLFCAVLFLQTIPASPAAAQTTSYAARGVVEKIAPDLSTVTIHHEAITGYMMEMTMDFPVKNTNELAGIMPQDKVTFTLMVTQTNEWIENIHRVGHSTETMTNNMPGMPGMQMNSSDVMMFTAAKPGDLLPDYGLTDENGNQIHLSDFRGRVVAFTFFFTRCPLPDFCPRMNNDFKQTREILTADANAPTNWQFLSISFDPAFDTPDVLTTYAGAFRGSNADRWLFASASTNVLTDAVLRLGLIVMQQSDGISHNMRTIVLDTQGRLYKQFNGNLWTPQQLADAMKQAARS